MENKQIKRHIIVVVILIILFYFLGITVGRAQIDSIKWANTGDVLEIDSSAAWTFNPTPWEYQEVTFPIDSSSTRGITEDLLYRYEEYCRTTETIVGYRYIFNESESLTGTYTATVTEVYRSDQRWKVDNPDYYRYLPQGYAFTEYDVWQWIKFEDNRLWRENKKYTDPEGKTRGYNMTYIRAEEIKQTVEPTFIGFIKYLKDERNRD